jgi:hypothetical protein
MNNFTKVSLGISIFSILSTSFITQKVYQIIKTQNIYTDKDKAK